MARYLLLAAVIALAGCREGVVDGGSGGSTASTASSGTSTTGCDASAGCCPGSCGPGMYCGSDGQCVSLAVTGLADVADWKRTLTFPLACTASACTYRYAIDASPSGSAGTGAYAAIDEVVVNPDPGNPTTPSGSHYLHVQARDAAGIESPVASASFRIDVTPPTTPGSVTSGLASDLPRSDPTATASWSASTDAESGLAGYEVRVVRLADDFAVADLPDASSGASIPLVGLQEGDYAVEVRARDAVGNLSAPGLSPTSTLAYSGGDDYSDDPNIPIRTGKPTFGMGLYAVPTFHSVGLYWATTAGSASNVASVQFRPAGTSAWRAGLPLWFDARNSEYRGSLVLLQPGTQYEVQTTLDTGETATTTVTTWSETFPVGETVTLPASSSATYTIDESGTPTAYRLYTAAAGGSVIDQGFPMTGQSNCVDVYGSYVIVRGLTLKNCQGNGIAIHAGAHDVIIEGNDISGFGSGPTSPPPVEGPTDQILPGYYEEGGVYCKNVGSSPKAFRIVVQRNKIHDPRYGSINWNYAHPNSDNAIFFGHCGPNNVFRYNDIYAEPGHYWGDAIGGSDNFTFEGFPNADSDIYGNRISDSYDDAIEADGANRNVRIWGNYIHHTFVAISEAANSVGPSYTFRNVINETGGMFAPITETPDAEDRGEIIKAGSEDALVNGGRMYVFHNTSLQPQPPAGSNQQYTMGLGGGVANAAGPAYELVTRNNIFFIYKDWHESIDVDGSDGLVDVDYDLYNGGLSGTPNGAEANGIVGAPIFNANVDPALQESTLPTAGSQYHVGTLYLPTTDPSVAGDFTLAPSSPGYHRAVALPNFNDAYGTPDMGAHQSGTPPMEFGVNAYPNGFPANY